MCTKGSSSTQYDQKFVYGRTIYQSISNVVDSIFNQFISRTTQTFPFFAQYNDGRNVNNPGWLSQWGSVDLANAGYKAIDIIRHYYGSNMTIREARLIEGAPFSFPGNILSAGSCGDAVQKMQIELNYISSSYPQIPKMSSTDGIFGDETRRAVEAFQRIFGLPVTGVVDFATWYRISFIYVGVSKMLQGRY